MKRRKDRVRTTSPEHQRSDHQNEQHEEVFLAVVGAHLQGLPLNHELTALGAVLVRATCTQPLYRLYELPGEAPLRPGLVRVGESNGSAIEVEVWSLLVAAFGAFVTRVPPPLVIGTVALESGDAVKGFLCESYAIVDANDISHFHGWRHYLSARG